MYVHMHMVKLSFDDCIRILWYNSCAHFTRTSVVIYYTYDLRHPRSTAPVRGQAGTTPWILIFRNDRNYNYHSYLMYLDIIILGATDRAPLVTCMCDAGLNSTAYMCVYVSVCKSCTAHTTPMTCYIQYSWRSSIIVILMIVIICWGTDWWVLVPSEISENLKLYILILNNV